MRDFQMNLLARDLMGIQAFLDEFDPPANGEDREVELNSTNEAVVIRNFPLPDAYDPEFIDVLVLVPDYPARPPIGIYLLENEQNADVIGQLRRIFNVMQTAFYGAPTVPGFAWICVHYQGDAWRFNPDHLASGDNLRKFFINFFNRLQMETV